MSLVGPRPWPIPLVKEQIASGVDYRNYVRAGWTGLAQLQKSSKGYVDSSAHPPSLDLEYIELCKKLPGWRLCLFDLGVLWKTFMVMLESKGLKN